VSKSEESKKTHKLKKGVSFAEIVKREKWSNDNKKVKTNRQK
jgi:hypothetical protein